MMQGRAAAGWLPTLAGMVSGAALLACVSSSEIVPAGKDSFMVVGRANGGLNAGKGLIAATKSANAYCAALHKVMILRHVESNGNAAVFGENQMLIFSCVNEDDPEYQRPNLKKDATAVIEDHRK